MKDPLSDVPRCPLVPKAYELAWIIEVGTPRVVLMFELCDVYQHVLRRWLSCFGM